MLRMMSRKIREKTTRLSTVFCPIFCSGLKCIERSVASCYYSSSGRRVSVDQLRPAGVKCCRPQELRLYM